MRLATRCAARRPDPGTARRDTKSEDLTLAPVSDGGLSGTRRESENAVGKSHGVLIGSGYISGWRYLRKEQAEGFADGHAETSECQPSRGCQYRTSPPYLC
jgi:hypothetical protein